MVADTLQ